MHPHSDKLIHALRVFFFLFLFLLINPLSAVYPASADVLPVLAPPGQSVLSAQTEKGTAGACYQGLGRSILLYWSASFNLDQAQVSGFGIYVTTRPDRYGPLDTNHFRLDLRKGLEPSLSDNSRIIFSNLSPSGSSLVEEYNDGVTISQTSLLYFTFPSPIILSKPLPSATNDDNYFTAYLSCSVPPLNPTRYILRETGSYRVGLYRLYNETTQTYGSGNSLALNMFLYSPSTGQANSSKPVPPFRPLILIHGLGGKPEDWINGRTNYQTYLRSLGYPDDYVHYYSYGYKNGQYNYQGDIRDISLGMEEVVNRLSEKYKADGGDGKVDLLGFSLGGVVARQYLSSHLTNHKVHKLITVGSPHQGVWVLNVDNGIYSFPGIGPSAEQILSAYILREVNQNKAQKLDINATAVKQIYPGSEFLDGYYGINRRVPQDVEYATFYGDIHASIRRKLFSSVIDKKVSIGDGLILPESASGIPSVSPEKHAYSENAVISLKLEKLGNSYALNVDLPNSSLLSAFHTYLLDRSDLRKDLACLVLGKKDANLCQ